jgi:ABC-type bacteriocin/lantibiotic exporter with double-glycine peptidase domain
MKALITSGKYKSLQSFLAFGLPMLSTVATFTLYKHINGKLEPSKVFMAVSLFEFLNQSMAILPNAVNEYRRMFISLRRIQRLLIAPDTFRNEARTPGSGRVTVREATFGHTDEKDSFRLNNINFEVQPGEVINGHPTPSGV